MRRWRGFVRAWAKGDSRKLGCAVTLIALDGEPIAVTDRRLTRGFHEAEAGWHGVSAGRGCPRQQVGMGASSGSAGGWTVAAVQSRAGLRPAEAAYQGPAAIWRSTIAIASAGVIRAVSITMWGSIHGA